MHPSLPWAVCGAVLCGVVCAVAQQPPLAEEGFDHFYNLEYDQALTVFEKMIAQNPSAPEPHNHVAQTLVFREMYRDGALESELVNGNNSFLRRAKLNPSAETERRFLGEVAKAIELSEARLKQNPKDTTAMYAEGIAYGLRANYFWVVKKSWHDSLKDATSARKLHNRVSEIEPGNVDARLVQGLHDYIVGSLPWNWKMLGFLVGIHGDKEKGIRTVREVAANGKLNRVDAKILLCALYRRENQPKQAVPIVLELMQKYQRNYLLRLELAQMYSMGGDGAKGLEVLREVERLKNARAAGFEGLAWEKVWYQEGSIQFWYNDLDQSIENLRRVTARADEVDLNTGVMAWLRMGQAYDLKNRRNEALDAYRRAIAYAPSADAAVEAKRYLSSPYRRM